MRGSFSSGPRSLFFSGAKGCIAVFRRWAITWSLRAISTPILFFVLREALRPWGRVHRIALHKIYYFGFFATYLASRRAAVLHLH